MRKCIIDGCNNWERGKTKVCRKHEKLNGLELITIKEDFAEIKLLDKSYKIIGIALIDTDDIEKVKNKIWRMDNAGYVKNNNTRLHNLILNDKFIDHINRNRLDNRKQNLRKCTSQQNNCNRVHISSKTGVRGVKKTNNRYYARVIHNKKEYNLGGHATIEEAKKARIDFLISNGLKEWYND